MYIVTARGGVCSSPCLLATLLCYPLSLTSVLEIYPLSPVFALPVVTLGKVIATCTTLTHYMLANGRYQLRATKSRLSKETGNFVILIAGANPSVWNRIHHICPQAGLVPLAYRLDGTRPCGYKYIELPDFNSKKLALFKKHLNAPPRAKLRYFIASRTNYD